MKNKETKPARTEQKLLKIRMEDVSRNNENPRLHFPEPEIEKLIESIDEVGILVPISVFEKKPNSGKYIIIDGERRWICAGRLGLKEIPSIVMEKPNKISNLTTMFNIHKVREEWQDMPTAWGIQKLIERTGNDDTKFLSRSTGIHEKEIRKYQLALELPKRYQNLIDEKKIGLNFFWEIEVSIIRPLEKLRPKLFNEFGPKGIRDAFVDKKLSGVVTDNVDLRRMPSMIKFAADEATEPGGRSEFDTVIRKLIKDKNLSVQDAYEAYAEMNVELDKFIKQCASVVKKYDKLSLMTSDTKDKQRLKKALKDLHTIVSKRIGEV